MSVHLIKLAVGVEDFDHLLRIQAARRAQFGQVFHLTRSFPRRAEELIAEGSIYWVIRGLTGARQRILDIQPHDSEQGRKCRLVLDPELVAVERRPHKAFQGWRYLPAADAPPDRASGEAEPPPEMAAELRRLGLL